MLENVDTDIRLVDKSSVSMGGTSVGCELEETASQTRRQVLVLYHLALEISNITDVKDWRHFSGRHHPKGM